MPAVSVWIVLIGSILVLVLGLGSMIVIVYSYLFRVPLLREGMLPAEFQKRLERLYRDILLGLAFALGSSFSAAFLILWDSWPGIVQYFQSLGK